MSWYSNKQRYAKPNDVSFEREEGFVASITRDDIDKSVIRALDSNDKIISWVEGEVRAVTLQGGKILVDVINGNNVVIDPEEFIFDYLKTIVTNENGSFDIVDSEGVTTRIPAGFPTRVSYEGDNLVTLLTDDGQQMEIDVLESVGSMVKCVSKDCSGNIVFDIESTDSCGTCSSGQFTIPLSDIGVETDPVYESEKSGLARNSQQSGDIVTLNNGDGSDIKLYSQSKLDEAFEALQEAIDSIDTSGGGGVEEESDPIYTAEKSSLASNSTEDAGVVTLNNGDGSSITVFTDEKVTELIDSLELTGGGLEEEVDPVFTAALPTLEKNHVSDGEIVMLSTGADELETVYTKAKVDNAINGLIDKLQHIILSEEVAGPVSMDGSAVKVVEFEPIETTGKYRGSMVATFEGSGLREYTVEIYINDTTTGRLESNSITDNHTITLSTVIPLELEIDDVVSVYVTLPSGSVTNVSASMELMLGTGSGTDLSGLEKDHTEYDGTVVLTNSNDVVSGVYSTEKSDELLDAKLDKTEALDMYYRWIPIAQLAPEMADLNFAEVMSYIRTYVSGTSTPGSPYTAPFTCSGFVALTSEIHGAIKEMMELFGITVSSTRTFNIKIDMWATGAGEIIIYFNNNPVRYAFYYDNFAGTWLTENASAFRYLGATTGIAPSKISTGMLEV